MHRYGNLEFTNKISFKELVLIINKANIEEERELLWQRYLAILPYYTDKNYVTFNQYYEERMIQANVKQDTRSTDELMKEIIEIEAKFERK